MEWSRIFVSGPVDPTCNLFKFYCQLLRPTSPFMEKVPENFCVTTQQRNTSETISGGGMSIFTKWIKSPSPRYTKLGGRTVNYSTSISWSSNIPNTSKPSCWRSVRNCRSTTNISLEWTICLPRPTTGPGCNYLFFESFCPFTATSSSRRQFGATSVLS